MSEEQIEKMDSIRETKLNTLKLVENVDNIDAKLDDLREELGQIRADYYTIQEYVEANRLKYEEHQSVLLQRCSLNSQKIDQIQGAIGILVDNFKKMVDILQKL